MGRFNRSFIVVVTVVVCALVAQTKALESRGQITDVESAIDRAIEYTGFDRVEGYLATAQPRAELLTITSDSTPYVGRLLSGRKVWQVSLPDVPLAAIGRPGGRNTTSTFDVLIDPENGKLLKLYSRFADTSYMVPGVDPPDESLPKKMVTSTGDTVTFGVFAAGPKPGEKDPIQFEIGFAGLPDSPPAAFLDVMRHSCVEMTKSIELEAVYVLKKGPRGHPAEALWKVWLKGYPKGVRSSGPGSSFHSEPRHEVFLFTVLVTADGRFGDCATAQESRWATLVGDLPPAGRRYQQFVKAVEIPGETLTDDHSAILMVINPPGELLVTDPGGRRTGLDPLTGQTYQEIPRASYFDNSIGTPDGSDLMESRQYHASRPLSGDYTLTVTGTDSGAYSLGIHGYYNLDENSRWSFHQIPITKDGVHRYALTLDRLSAARSVITGGFDGGRDQEPDVNNLLSYVNIEQGETKMAPGTASIDLFIIYGETVLPETFGASLNEQAVSGQFTPQPGGYETVGISLHPGENVLTLSIEGSTEESRVRDTDSLVFVVE